MMYETTIDQKSASGTLRDGLRVSSAMCAAASWPVAIVVADRPTQMT